MTPRHPHARLATALTASVAIASALLLAAWSGAAPASAEARCAIALASELIQTAR